MTPATNADALRLLNTYGVASKGYRFTDPSQPAATAYWKTRIDAVGWDAAIVEIQNATRDYIASNPLPVITGTPAIMATPTANASGISPGLLIIGALAAFFLLKDK